MSVIAALLSSIIETRLHSSQWRADLGANVKRSPTFAGGGGYFIAGGGADCPLPLTRRWALVLDQQPVAAKGPGAMCSKAGHLLSPHRLPEGSPSPEHARKIMALRALRWTAWCLSVLPSIWPRISLVSPGMYTLDAIAPLTIRADDQKRHGAVAVVFTRQLIQFRCRTRSRSVPCLRGRTPVC